MSNKKKLTILHSNDLHGDFLAEKNEDRELRINRRDRMMI